MGPALSRDTSRNNNDRNRRENRETSNRPTKRIRTNSSSNNSTMSGNSEDDLEAIQNDVEEVEQISVNEFQEWLAYFKIMSESKDGD